MAGAQEAAPYIPVDGTVAVPIAGDDALPDITISGQTIDIPAANGCGFALQASYDHCSSAADMGYGAFVVSNLPEPVTVAINGDDTQLEPGEQFGLTVPFNRPFEVTFDGEEVPVVTTLEGCEGPLSIEVFPSICPSEPNGGTRAAIINRVAVEVAFNVDGTEASLKPGEARVSWGSTTIRSFRWVTGTSSFRTRQVRVPRWRVPTAIEQRQLARDPIVQPGRAIAQGAEPQVHWLTGCWQRRGVACI
jgi:hypothetical protein